MAVSFEDREFCSEKFVEIAQETPYHLETQSGMYCTEEMETALMTTRCYLGVEEYSSGNNDDDDDNSNNEDDDNDDDGGCDKNDNNYDEIETALTCRVLVIEDEPCRLGIQVETPVTSQWNSIWNLESLGNLANKYHLVHNDESVQSSQGKQNQEEAVQTKLYVNDSEPEYFQTNYEQKECTSNNSYHEYQDDQDQIKSSNTLDDQSYQSKKGNEPTDSLELGPDVKEIELSYPERDRNNKAESARGSNSFCLKLIWMYLVVLIHVTNANSRFSHEPPQEMYVDEGRSISLSYSMKDNDEYSVIWTKDDIIICNESVNYYRYTIVSDLSKNLYKLTIDPVSREDEGSYKCVAVQPKEPDLMVFSSDTYIFVEWLPGPQYPKIVLLNEVFNVGKQVIAYCISEVIKGPQPELSWVDTPGVSSSFQNESHFGITLKVNATEDMNQMSIHCSMFINIDEPPRTTTSKPINITKQQTTITTTETITQSSYTSVRDATTITKVNISTLPDQIEDAQIKCWSTHNTIISMVVSHFFVLLVYLLLSYFFWRRRRRRSNVFKNDRSCYTCTAETMRKERIALYIEPIEGGI